MDNHTLDKIRQTRSENETREKNKLENYKSPSGGIIVKNYMKALNLDIIETFCSENNLSSRKCSELKEKYHQYAYYAPVLTRLLEPEKNFIEDNR